MTDQNFPIVVDPVAGHVAKATTAQLSGVTPATTVVGPDSYGASPAVGVSLNYARQDHDHGLPGASGGVSPATTVTGPDPYGASAVVGSSLLYARQDHDHGLPSTPVTSAVAGTGIGVSGATGAVTITNTAPATETGAATTVIGPDAYGASAVVGTSLKFARADHDHGLPASGASGAWSGLTGKPWYTFSASTVADGSDYIAGANLAQAFFNAIAAIVAAGGGTLYVRAGLYVLNGPLIVYNSSLTTPVDVVFDNNATVQVNGTPSWHITCGANVRYPHVLLTGCSYVNISGGQFVSATAIGSQPAYLGGVHIASGVSYVEIHHMTFQGLTNFALHASGGYSASTGLPSGAPSTSEAAAAYSYISVHDISADTMGASDGGGLRFGNDNNNAAKPTAFRIWAGKGCVFTNILKFGIDIANGSMAAPLQYITIEGAYVQGPAGASQNIGFDGENASAAGPVLDFVIKDCVFTGFNKCGIIGAYWQGGVVDGCLFTNSYYFGLDVGSSNGTTNNIILRDLRCTNNGQAGNSTLGLASGLVVGSISNAGTLSNITVEGGDFSDYQASPTQHYGLCFCNGGGATITNVTLFEGWVAIGNTVAAMYAGGSAYSPTTPYLTAATPGTVSPTSLGTVAPAGASTTPRAWGQVNISGTIYYVPMF